MLTIFLYRLLFLPVFFIVAPYYAFRMRKRGGYKEDFQFRFGLFKKLPKRKFGKKRLWIQAVSVGELKAIAKLMDLLIESGQYEIVLTTTTSTSYSLAKKLYGGKILFIGLFPFDFWLFSWMAWNRIFPHVIILVENEIWPEHIWQAKTRGVPVILVNARISDRTFARYKILGNLPVPILDEISYVISSDQISADRCRKIGISSRKIKTAGNIKFDNVCGELSPEKRLSLRTSLGFKDGDLILLGSSTWEKEEGMLIAALKACWKFDKRWKLLLVPRHAERRAEVAALLNNSGLKWHQRSLGSAQSEVEVCLVDTTGELQLLTSLADLAFIGKSLSPNDGGQSPLDAACCGVPVIYGDKMTNFRDICSSLELHKCAVKVKNHAQAINAITSLAKDETKRSELSENLLKWHKNNCGASEFVAQKIHDIAFAKK